MPCTNFLPAYEKIDKILESKEIVERTTYRNTNLVLSIEQVF